MNVHWIKNVAMAALAATAFIGQGGAAQSMKAWPDHPVRIVVPFPPGGSADFLGRQLGQELGQLLGQPFVVDNRPGGNGVIGADIASKAPADGYTLFMPLDGTMTMNPSVYTKLPYDPQRSFEPVSMLVMSSNLIVGNGKTVGKTLDDVLAYAAANPGKVTYGAATLIGQLTGEQIKAAAGVDMVYVPFKGSAEVQQSLLSGDIDFAVVDVSPFAAIINSGKLSGLATTGPVRHVMLPNVPTVIEAGKPLLESRNWFGLFAPSGTPAPIIAKLNAAVATAMSNAALRARLIALGQQPIPGSPEVLATQIQSDSKKWSPLIKAAGIHFD